MGGLLAATVIAMTSHEASARVCLIFQGGRCVFFSGSVECDIVADQFGSTNKNPKVDCQIEAPGDGLLACANGGAKGKTAPGIQVIQINAAETFGAFASITKSDITNGVATVDVTASLLGDPLTQLGEIYCPNANWSAVAYVPCETNATVTLRNDSGQLDQVAYECTLPSCDTLQFDLVTHKFERRQYECNLLP
jgi:hypothetical protein